MTEHQKTPNILASRKVSQPNHHGTMRRDLMAKTKSKVQNREAERGRHKNEPQMLQITPQRVLPHNLPQHYLRLTMLGRNRPARRPWNPKEEAVQ